MIELSSFKKIIWDYYKKNKRDLPWRNTTDPYHILISEVMLQQTQVSRILIKYSEFLDVFPTFESLVYAKLTDLLKVWKGIGYNRRALYLKRTAEIVVEKYNGILPQDPKILETFPGIGQATANSIACYAFNYPAIFIETNIRRIYIHFFFADQEGVHDKDIMPLVEKTVDKKNPREWYWALMDYGTMLAKAVPNPNRKSKHYVVQSKFVGSTRQLRGKIIGFLLEYTSASREALERIVKDDERLYDVLDTLEKDGFVKQKKGVYTIA